MPTLRDLLSDSRVHVVDGAMGTMLYGKGVFINRCFESLNLSQPARHGEIALAKREDVDFGIWGTLEARRRLHAYHWRRHRPSRRRSLGFFVARLVHSLHFGRGRT